MLEIEMKFPVADFSPIVEKLQLRRAAQLETRAETDRYFNAPDRDFAQTDEALRLRSVDGRNIVTYKGPKTDAFTKTRKEIETELIEGENAAHDFCDILLQLGYRKSGIVEKQRTLFQINKGDFSIEVCLDDVRILGQFVELEIQATEKQLEPARAALQELAEELNLAKSERRSYLELQLALQCEGRS